MDTVQTSLLTLLSGCFIALFIFYLQSNNGLRLRSKSKSNLPTFLILGNNNSGKTALYYNFLSSNQESEDTDESYAIKKVVPTVSSLESNESIIKLPFANPAIQKNFKIIDFPGHSKYLQLMKKLILEDISLANLKGIIFVIDSSSNAVNQDDKFNLIAKKLFEILSETEKLPNGVDFLFAINKQDLFDSIPIHKIKSKLESALNEIISNELNRSGAGGEDDEEEEEKSKTESNEDYETRRQLWSIIMQNGKPFKFEILEGNMEFVGGSVLKNKTEAWENWFDERVVNYGGM